MLIAITSEGMELNSLVAEKFGRTPFIIFYDNEKNTFESIRNPYANSLGGAGIQTSQILIEKNASAVITIEIGLNLILLLQSANIKVYSCSRKKVIEVIKDYNEGKLSECLKGTKINFSRKRHRRKGWNWNNDV